SPYLIEIRLSGPVKFYTKRLIFEVSRKFRVFGATKNRPVPHITLFGPFLASNESELISIFDKYCANFSNATNSRAELISYDIRGFDAFDGDIGKVIALDLEPSEKLKDFRWELAKNLHPISRAKPWDYKRNFIFHATIAFRDIGKKWTSILNYLRRREKGIGKQYVYRITLLKNSKILREYDFLMKKSLTRTEAKSTKIGRKYKKS
ncbi:MAG: 2'-5' RNA ligase family protein, partial [Candidatus Micrarchaeota archaeon]